MLLAVLAFTTWVYLPLAEGLPPGSWDHNWHLLKVRETEALVRRNEWVP